jgi:hypothetical protein
MLGVFNDEGQERWLKILEDRETDPSGLLLRATELATNKDMYTQLPGSMELKPFTRRRDFAIYLDTVITSSNLLTITGETKFWNWMAARWMQTLVESDPRTNLKRKIGKQIERWALSSSTLNYHRHLVSSPFFAFVDNERNADLAMCLLSTPILEPGEVVEKIAGKKAFSSGSVCELATHLYYDPVADGIKPGVTVAPGHPKGFSRFFGQLDNNVDYQSLNKQELLALLPESFDKWK